MISDFTIVWLKSKLFHFHYEDLLIAIVGKSCRLIYIALCSVSGVVRILTVTLSFDRLLDINQKSICDFLEPERLLQVNDISSGNLSLRISVTLNLSINVSNLKFFLKCCAVGHRSIVSFSETLKSPPIIKFELGYLESQKLILVSKESINLSFSGLVL